jgi:S-disulfanyl-L-cysteine oxidoreductase SoxD
MQIINRSTGLIIVGITLGLTVAGRFAAPSSTVTAQTVVATPTRQAVYNLPGTTFGFGQPATREEITAWDTDVRPDGVGLPPGSGTVAEGANLYAQHCAGCHGIDGRESPVLLPFRSLVGEYDPATWPAWPLTIGNYWPYATTVFDYTRRAMPYTTPGILTDDEVYAITAWLLNQNGLIPDDAVMDAESLPQVKMPALQHYVPHDWRDSYPYQ